MQRGLVGSEMCIRDRVSTQSTWGTLTILNLNWNKIEDKGAEFIAAALKSNSTLTILNLSFNEIGNKGAEFIAAALKSNRTLTTLDLCENEIGDKGVELITTAFNLNNTIQKINLSLNNISEKDLILNKKCPPIMLQHFQSPKKKSLIIESSSM
eukprot:TRINITY_DN7200_c0_g2_i7.p1 TRINITY_DN7200_c0_g2~~TRINITY_DN7200_c0_g2_i7.p1  ORF type:complete len:154 (+),score=36.29 TRINITY_DN7200_c0_g2_i7:131-592(+)